MNVEKKQKESILIVDDSELNRSLLCDMLECDFNILEAANGEEAIAILQDREIEIALMLLDIVMPEMDGFDVLAMMNSRGWIKSVPVIMISAETGSSYIDRAYDLGAVDYISRPFDERTVKHRVMSNYAFASKQKDLTDNLVAQVYANERDNRIMVEILSHIVEFRNGESGLHILHVNTFTGMILKQLLQITDKYELTQAQIKTIVNASALHDIGKMTVPESILNKPGKLTKEEFEIMKLHTVDGYKMLNDIPYRNDEPIIKVSKEICRWHHERFDGSGYPDGLKGDEIPISAQVVALADVYDALTSKRAYKDAFTHERAVEMIQNGECGVFNPIILKCLDSIKDELKKQIHEVSPGHCVEADVRDNVEQMLKSSDTDVSGRTIRLLERERMKFKFFSELSREVMFEYITSPDRIVLTDFSAEYLGLPETIFNPRESDLANRVFDLDDFDGLIARMRETSPENPVFESRYMLTVKGEKKWNKVITRTIWSGDEKPEFEGAIGKCIDITEETEELRHLEDLADKDPITGLLNARAAKRKIIKRLSTSYDGKYAMVFFDLDNLKLANDKYGHLYGDKLIKTVAERMSENTRSNDICARLGGDEFLIFLHYSTGLDKLIDRIFKRLTCDMEGFPVRLSMGIALVDGNSVDYDELFHKADQTAYAVKRGAKNSYKFYDDLTEEEKALKITANV